MSDVKRLMSIGEVAKSLGMTRRMILNYEDRGLLQPDVKEGHTGYRYYSPDTLTRIYSIRVFQKMGLSLDEIRSYFDGSADLPALIARLELLRGELDLNIEKLRTRVRNDDNRIFRASFPSQIIYRLTFRASTVEDRKEKLRDILPTVMREYGSDTSHQMYFIEYPLHDPDLISYCIAVPKGSQGEFIFEFPQSSAICIYHHGGYEELPAVREELLASAMEQKLNPAGTCRHIYLEGPPQHKDKSKYITQVVLPVENLRADQ